MKDTAENNEIHQNTEICNQKLLEARLKKLNTDLTQLKDQNEELQKQFNLIVNSNSWKLTAPLRALMALKKFLFPLYRSIEHKLELKIYRSITQENTDCSGSLYSISGATPTFDLIIDPNLYENNFIREGWYSYEANVATNKGTLFFFLYFGTADGFSETKRVLLSFDHQQNSRHAIYIPEATSTLRLEVYDFEGKFEINNLKLRSLGSINLFNLLFSKYILPLLKEPATLLVKLRKAVNCYKEGGLWALRAKVFGGRVTSNYNEWVARFDAFNEDDLPKIRAAADQLKAKPKISIITPVYNPPIKYFKQCLDSVIKQAYQNWELCLADDCSTDPEIKNVIQQYCLKDCRIKAVFREQTGHISAASNSATAVATGEYLAFLDHDDELTPDALFLVAREINLHPQAGLIYSDEDKKTTYGLRINPHFKSDWNPELLLQQNYICHLLVIKKDLVDKAGGLRSEFDGAQDWDLILRVSEKLQEQQIRHIPHILYHWTLIQSSTAQSTSAKPYVLEAQRKAVQQYLDRNAENATARIWHSISHISVERELSASDTKASLIILTRDKVKLLRQCVDSILKKTTYKNYEIIIVDNGSIEDVSFEYFQSLSQYPNVRIIRDEREFNFSALNNLAARQASGSVLAFLNNDLEIIEGDWLEKMLAQVQRKTIGAVGARLLFPSNLLQHAGVILGIGGVAGHNHKGRLREDPGYFNRAILSQNLSAVTAACVLIRKEVFEEINGFDEQLSVAFNDVDLCLRIRQAGYKLVYEPKAELYHHESASRGYENTPEKFRRFEYEIEIMKNRWKKTLIEDPYYNPNLTNLSEDFVFAFPPRVTRAWK